LPPAVRRSGKAEVSVYFTRYSETPIAWRMEPAFVDGRPGLLATDPADGDSRFVVLLDWSDGRIVTIRDVTFVRYVMDGIDIVRI
jgi:RNA polymerase sigma-70 factor (ECF subfamily)